MLLYTDIYAKVVNNMWLCVDINVYNANPITTITGSIYEALTMYQAQY